MKPLSKIAEGRDEAGHVVVDFGSEGGQGPVFHVQRRVTLMTQPTMDDSQVNIRAEKVAENRDLCDRTIFLEKLINPQVWRDCGEVMVPKEYGSHLRLATERLGLMTLADEGAADKLPKKLHRMIPAISVIQPAGAFMTVRFGHLKMTKEGLVFVCKEVVAKPDETNYFLARR
ncbi:hypothetical protein KKC94_05520 [Patescibacteria group bacterium]|nr:hypothetical protein [Patescibacteria group bacterium]